MTVCAGSGTVVQDMALVLGAGASRYIECPVCFRPFSLPTGGLWTGPTVPDHLPQTSSIASGEGFDAGVELS